jgi:hypothetical protein
MRDGAPGSRLEGRSLGVGARHDAVRQLKTVLLVWLFVARARSPAVCPSGWCALAELPRREHDRAMVTGAF